MASPVTVASTPPLGRGSRRTANPSSRRMSIRIDEAEWTGLNAIAQKEQVAVSEVVRICLMEVLGRKGVRLRLVESRVEMQPARIDEAAAMRLEQIGGMLVARLGQGGLNLEERTLIRDTLATARIVAGMLRGTGL